MYNNDNKKEIPSGKIAEEIRECLTKIEGITSVSPILSDGYNGNRIGKDYSLYTIDKGKKQFTIIIIDSRYI